MNENNTKTHFLSQLLMFFLRHWKGSILSFCIGVFFYYIDFNPTQFAADRLRNWDSEIITSTVRSEVRSKSQPLSWQRPDYHLFEWIRQLYADQISNSPDTLSYAPPKMPLQIAQFRWIPQERYGSGYLVRWSSHCNNEGCRYDIIKYRDNIIIFSFFARGVKWSARFINKNPVLVDILGRIIYFDGQKFIIDSTGAAKNPE